MRLIDADALIDDCKKYLNKLNPSRDGKEYTRIHWLIGILSNAHAIEPERKTGKAIVKSTGYRGYWACDQCGTEIKCTDNFCRHCGVDLRGKAGGN